MQKRVEFVDLKTQYFSIRKDIDKAVKRVLESANYSAGPFVKSFEENFAKTHKSKYCIGVNSGTSALHCALLALGITYGDEVIVPTNTFFATAEAVSLTGATPIFLDCEEKYYNIDPCRIEDSITDKTKAIIAVHLYGLPAKIDKIAELAQKHDLFLIEDCAQAHQATYKGIYVGNFGICGCFSFYPSKNLGAYGEAGAVITNDEDMLNNILSIRNHGSDKKYLHDRIGHNYRMEGLQGAILDVKLKYLSEWTEKRRKIAEVYCDFLKNIPQILLPQEDKDSRHVFHLFVIRTKDRKKLSEFLQKNGIQTGIHYPVPCHSQKAYAFLKYSPEDFPVAEKYASEILSLPMYPELQEEEIAYVSDKIKEFYRV